MIYRTGDQLCVGVERKNIIYNDSQMFSSDKIASGRQGKAYEKLKAV